MVPKPGFIAEYFPEDYEDGIIPEGVDPDIVRTEKQLDFEEAIRRPSWCSFLISQDAHEVLYGIII